MTDKEWSKSVAKFVRHAEETTVPIFINRMNSKLVCFNVDPAFNYALDGLIVVDLTSVPARALGKYMGRQEALEYLALKRF